MRDGLREERTVTREPRRRCPFKKDPDGPECGGPMVVEQTAYKGRLPQRDVVCVACGYREKTGEHVISTSTEKEK